MKRQNKVLRKSFFGKNVGIHICVLVELELKAKLATLYFFENMLVRFETKQWTNWIFLTWFSLWFVEYRNIRWQARCFKDGQVSVLVHTSLPYRSIYFGHFFVQPAIFFMMSIWFRLTASFWRCAQACDVWFWKYSTIRAMVVNWSEMNMLFSYKFISNLNVGEARWNPLSFILETYSVIYYICTEV